jgi:hypothetical protein
MRGLAKVRPELMSKYSMYLYVVSFPRTSKTAALGLNSSYALGKPLRNLSPELLMIETCPKCGGTAVLLQTIDEIREYHDLTSPDGKAHLPVKVEEFRCQEPNCEHEFEKIIREPAL